ncbi:MAG: twin-arginine translocation signal domain-containing protein, partial [Thermoanaerobaculales bacterium]|nr:twin-arginine translocation signal domain-containing protein [Thermoanaerobaculales bacterium]
MDQSYIDLYDEFTHGTMSRREFMDRLAKAAGGATAAAALVPILQNNYAEAGTVPEDDPRLVTE